MYLINRDKKKLLTLRHGFVQNYEIKILIFDRKPIY